MKTVQLIEEQISSLEKNLIQYNKVSDLILEEMSQITSETEDGKPKFSNDIKRTAELKSRIPNLLTEKKSLEIEIEILRLKIKTNQLKLKGE